MCLKTEDAIRDYFPRHVATYERHGDVEILRWREPGISTHAVTYVVAEKSRLAVWGDLFEGQYCFGFAPPLDMRGMANRQQDSFLDHARTFSGVRKTDRGRVYCQKCREWTFTPLQQAHYVGLKMAFAQIDARETEDDPPHVDAAAELVGVSANA